jgi:hypothetical protein
LGQVQETGTWPDGRLTSDQLAELAQLLRREDARRGKDCGVNLRAEGAHECGSRLR